VNTTRLKLHVLNKHIGNEKSFLCHKCPAKFVASSTLATHLQNKACGRKVGAPLKNKNAKTSTKKRTRNPKCRKVKSCSKPDQQENLSIPVETNPPPSPEICVPKMEENVDFKDTSYFMPHESNSLLESAAENTTSEVILSQIDRSLKDRICQTFRGQMRGGILQLIGKQVLSGRDLTTIVILAEEANLKTTEFIEAIIEGLPSD
jgi:hypothetical protein